MPFLLCLFPVCNIFVGTLTGVVFHCRLSFRVFRSELNVKYVRTLTIYLVAYVFKYSVEF